MRGDEREGFADNGAGPLRGVREATDDPAVRLLIALADAVPAQLACIDTDARFVFVNRGFGKVYRRPAEDFCGKTVREVLGEDLFSTVEPYLQRALAGEPVSYSGRFPSKAGVRSFDAHYVPDLDDQGRTRGVFALIFDTSRLADAAELARRRELRYRLLVETSPEATVVHREGTILFANEAAARLVGAPNADALLGRQVLDFVHAEDLSRAELVDRQLASDGRAIEHVEMRVRGLDGREAVVEVASLLVEWDGEAAEHVIARDITHRRRAAEDQLRSEKLESIGLLAGGIAHDFNNLLAAILGNIDLALSPGGSEATRTRQLEKAMEATLRARDLAGQLLTFAKGGTPVCAITDLASLLEDAVIFATHGSNVDYRLDVSEQLFPAFGDRLQLSQVFENIVVNAVQAMPDGGLLQVTAHNAPPLPNGSGEKSGPRIRITFEDEGPGISPQDLPRIFDPYFTTKQTGSGLGLSTAYSIVTQHGGSLSAHSVPGQGATFVIELPACADEEVTTEDTEEESYEAGGRILVMDDEDAVREVACEVLEALGYEPSGVPDGQAALAAFRKAEASGRPFAAVVMDLTIRGGMGGLEAVRELRKFAPDAVVIVASGYSNDPVLSAYQDYGFDGMIAKPFQVSDVSRAVRHALRKRGGETE